MGVALVPYRTGYFPCQLAGRFRHLEAFSLTNQKRRGVSDKIILKLAVRLLNYIFTVFIWSGPDIVFNSDIWLLKNPYFWRTFRHFKICCENLHFPVIFQNAMNTTVSPYFKMAGKRKYIKPVLELTENVQEIERWSWPESKQFEFEFLCQTQFWAQSKVISHDDIRYKNINGLINLLQAMICWILKVI